MTTFGDDLVQALSEVVAHAGKQDRIAIEPKAVRKRANLTQEQMAMILGVSLSGYRKWEQGTRPLSGPADALLRILDKEPAAVRRALLNDPKS